MQIYVKMQLVPSSYAIKRSTGEVQGKGYQGEFTDHLNTLEDGIRKDVSSKGPFIHGESPGLVDISMDSSTGGFKILTEIAGRDIYWRGKRCRFFHGIVKDALVPREMSLARPSP